MASGSDSTVEFVLRANVTDLLRSLGQASQGTREFGETARESSEQVNNAWKTLGVRSLATVQQEIDQVRQAYAELANSGTASAQDLERAQAAMEDRITGLRGEMGDLTDEQEENADVVGVLKDNWAEFLGALGALGGVVAVVMDLNAAFSEFETKMAEVNSLLVLGKDKYDGLKDSVLALSTDKQIPQTAVELGSALYDLVSAGVSLEKSSYALEQSAKAAVAGVTETKVAANAGMATINAYGMELSQLGSVYDKLFQTVKVGVTTFPLLSENIGDVLPNAKAANVSLDELFASIAQATKGGIGTSEAITAISAAIEALSRPGAEAKATMQDLTIEWNGLIGTLEQIRNKNLTAAQIAEIVPTDEGIKAVLSLTQNFDGLKSILDQVKNSAGSMQQAYEIMSKTPENQVKLLNNQVEKLKIQSGALVSQAFVPIVQGTTDLLKAFDDLDGGTQVFLVSIGLATMALSTWLIVGPQIVTAFTALTGAVSANAAALATQTTAMYASVAASQAGAFAIGVFGGALLGLGVVNTIYQLNQLYDTFQQFKDVQSSIDGVAKHYADAAKKYEEYKNIQLRGSDEIKKMNADELASYGDTLMQKTRLLAAQIAEQEALSQKGNALTFLTGGLYKTDEAAAAEENMKRLQAELDKVQESLGQVGERSREMGTQLAEAPKKAKFDVQALVSSYEKMQTEMEKNSDGLSKHMDLLQKGSELRQKYIELMSDESATEADLMAEREEHYMQLLSRVRQFYEQQSAAIDRNKAQLDRQAQAEGAAADKIAEYQAKILEAKRDAAQEAKEVLSEMLAESLELEKKYADDAKKIQDEIVAYRRSLDDELRNLERERMDEQQKLDDMRLQAAEKEAEARKALDAGDTESAKKLFDESKKIWMDIAKTYIQTRKEAEKAAEDFQKKEQETQEKSVEAYEKASEKKAAAQEKIAEKQKSLTEAYQALAKAERDLASADEKKAEAAGEKVVAAKEKVRKATEDLMEAEQKASEESRKATEGAATQAAKLADELQNAREKAAAPIGGDLDAGYEEATRKARELGEARIEVMQEEGKEAEELKDRQAELSELMRKSLEDINESLSKFAGSLDKIPEEKKTQILVSAPGLDDLIKKYESLKDKTVRVTVEQRTVEKKQTGGMAGLFRYERGGRFPGFGGGDILNVMAEPGEYFLNKYRTARFLPLIESLNFGNDSEIVQSIQWALDSLHNAPLPDAVRDVAAGKLAFQSGGQVPESGRTVTLNLNLGGEVFTTQTDEQTFARLERKLKRERRVRLD